MNGAFSAAPQPLASVPFLEGRGRGERRPAARSRDSQKSWVETFGKRAPPRKLAFLARERVSAPGNTKRNTERPITRHFFLDLIRGSLDTPLVSLCRSIGLRGLRFVAAGKLESVFGSSGSDSRLSELRPTAFVNERALGVEGYGGWGRLMFAASSM